MLGRGAFSAVSRMAREMDEVSPLRKASTNLNLRTDCSRLAVLLSAVGDVRACCGFGGCELEAVGERPAEETDCLAAWPRGLCWCAMGLIGFGVEDDGVRRSLPSSEPDSSSRVLLRRKRERAAADLDRLWVLKIRDKQRSVGGTTLMLGWLVLVKQLRARQAQTRRGS